VVEDERSDEAGRRAVKRCAMLAWNRSPPRINSVSPVLLLQCSPGAKNWTPTRRQRGGGGEQRRSGQQRCNLIGSGAGSLGASCRILLGPARKDDETPLKLRIET